MDGLGELRNAVRIAKKKVEDAEKEYAKDWKVLLDAKDKEQKDPTSLEAQAAHRRAIKNLNKNRIANNGLIDEWLRLRGSACEVDNPAKQGSLPQ
jgi:hypothetical protein